MAGLSGHRWRQLVERVKTEYAWVCWICHQPIPEGVPARTPRSFSVHHLTPRSKGGAVYDLANCRPAHYGCNSSQGDKPAQSWVTSPDW
ncbi:HNH endonuclease [Micromonospora sp. CPCC 205371]|nr:HNH endonuclease [Micromonospora sp. CPCC 205371]